MVAALRLRMAYARCATRFHLCDANAFPPAPDPSQGSPSGLFGLSDGCAGATFAEFVDART
jgi:hypothetical protein